MEGVQFSFFNFNNICKKLYFAIPLVVMILFGGLRAFMGKNSSIVGFLLGWLL
jgi:hypothetical protein